MKNVVITLFMVLLTLPVSSKSIDVIGTEHPICTSGQITDLIRPTNLVCKVDTLYNSTLTMSYTTKVYGEIAFDYSKYIHFTLNGELNEGGNRYLIKSIEKLLVLHGIGSNEAKREAIKLKGFPLHGSELVKTNHVLINTGEKKLTSMYVVQVFIK